MPNVDVTKSSPSEVQSSIRNPVTRQNQKHRLSEEEKDILPSKSNKFDILLDEMDSETLEFHDCSDVPVKDNDCSSG